MRPRPPRLVVVGRHLDEEGFRAALEQRQQAAQRLRVLVLPYPGGVRRADVEFEAVHVRVQALHAEERVVVAQGGDAGDDGDAALAARQALRARLYAVAGEAHRVDQRLLGGAARQARARIPGPRLPRDGARHQVAESQVGQRIEEEAALVEPRRQAHRIGRAHASERGLRRRRARRGGDAVETPQRARAQRRLGGLLRRLGVEAEEDGARNQPVPGQAGEDAQESAQQAQVRPR